LTEMGRPQRAERLSPKGPSLPRGVA